MASDLTLTFFPLSFTVSCALCIEHVHVGYGVIVAEQKSPYGILPRILLMLTSTEVGDFGPKSRMK